MEREDREGVFTRRGGEAKEGRICHCEPPGPAASRPEAKLREAIQCFELEALDCFVALLLAMTGVARLRRAAGMTR